jgi:hypothetical protein
MSVQPLTSSQVADITNYINQYRAKNGAPPLNYNATIAAFSQQWANHLLSNNLFQHSGTQLYGENLAYFQGYGTDLMALIKMSVDAWYNEISSYDFNNPGFSEATGHFTCLVWLSSTEYGIAISFDPSSTKAIITMNTSPPGNVIGQFQQNVLPTIVPGPISNPPPGPGPVPNPTPLPGPVPNPTPLPVPNPLPRPSNTSIQVQQILGLLNNLLNFLTSKQPRSYLVYQIQIISGLLVNTNIPIATHILQMLRGITTAIQMRKPLPTVAMAVQNIIAILQPYST